MAGNAGIYYELPPYTALELKDNEGNWVNRELKYQRVASGIVWDLPQQWSLEAKISAIGGLLYTPFQRRLIVACRGLECVRKATL